jgi:predicted negative regulator of RcsB-dependent stress response
LEDYLSEKEQWENVTRWLRENGLWILAGVVAGAIAIFGWQWWHAHIDQVNGEASAKYEQLQLDLNKGDRTGALILVADLQRDYASTPYVDQAHLALARVYVDSNELDKAAAELRAVSQQSKDKQLALVARIRLARVQIAQQKPDDALATLDGVDPGAFTGLFHEVRGDAEFAKGNKPAALTEYRAARMADMTGAGGGENSLLDLKISDLVAAVPPPASSVPAAAASLAPTSGGSAPATSTPAAPAAAAPTAPSPAPQNQAAK